MIEEVKKLPTKEVRTAKIRILRDVVIAPKTDAIKGELWEVPLYLAHELCGISAAERVIDPDEKPDPDALVTTSMHVATDRDPKPKKVR